MLTKINEGIFIGPQTTELKQDIKFEYQLSQVAKAAWKSFQNVAINFFLENHMDESYYNMVPDLV